MTKDAALREPKKKMNPLDKEGIAYIDYKDTALLRKFIPDCGNIRAGQYWRLWRRGREHGPATLGRAITQSDRSR